MILPMKMTRTKGEQEEKIGAGAEAEVEDVVAESINRKANDDLCYVVFNNNNVWFNIWIAFLY